MRPHPAAVSSAARVVLDGLEPRQLFAGVAAHLDGGRLVVQGTEKSDAIVITHGGSTTYVNDTAFADNKITKGISVYPHKTGRVANRGDRVTVAATVRPVDVYGQANVTADGTRPVDLFVGENGDSSNVKAAVVLHGQNATSRVTIDASNEHRDHTVGMAAKANAVTVFGLAGAVVKFDGTGVTALRLNGGFGEDEFDVHSTWTPSFDFKSKAVATTTIDGGSDFNAVYVRGADARGRISVTNRDGGHDYVKVGNNGSLDGIRGVIDVDNREFVTGIDIDDSKQTQGKQFGLHNTVRPDNGWAEVTYADNDGVTDLTVRHEKSGTLAVGIEAGRGVDTFRIDDTFRNDRSPSESSTDIRTGDGDDVVFVHGAHGCLALNGVGGRDEVTVGGRDHRTDAIFGTVSVSNDTGHTALHVDDSYNTVAKHARMRAKRYDFYGSITGVVPGLVEYRRDEVSTLMVSLGVANDTADVQGTFAGTDTMFHGGYGNDTFNVGNEEGNLDYVLGELTCVGSGGNDLLWVHDETATNHPTYSDNGHRIDRTGAASIVYDDIQWKIVNKAK